MRQKKENPAVTGGFSQEDRSASDRRDEKDWILPPRLNPGDRAALIAPASPSSPKRLAEAVRALQGLGLRPVIFPSCRSRDEYLSGSDSLRSQDFMRAFTAPDIRAVFCLRGGYGSARILDRIDYEILRRHPKIFVGFSDITALHAALNEKARLITYHAPMPSSYRSCDESITLSSLKAALFSANGAYELIKIRKEPKDEDAGYRAADEDPHDSRKKRLPLKPKKSMKPEAGRLSGRLCGGNLTVLASLLGTPYEPDLSEKLLFLEDVGEKTYRIDRAFTALRLAGKLRGCRGILLGTFSDCPPAGKGGRTCEAVIREIAAPLGIPVLSGLPFGHSGPNMTITCGARCDVLIGNSEMRLKISPMASGPEAEKQSSA